MAYPIVLFGINKKIKSFFYNLMNGVIPPSVNFSRSSDATFINAAGVLTSASTNIPRFDYDPATGTLRGLLYEPQRTNYIKNSTMIGAIDGTPGTQPTGWGMGLPSGCARSIVIGTENGMSYVDIRLYGSVTASSYSRYISFIGSTEIAALLDEKWTASTYVKLVAGSLSNVSNLGISIGEFSSGGSWLAGGSALFTPTDTLARYSYTRTLTNANTAYVQPTIGYSVTAGTSIDFTLRIYAPQLEKSAFASSYIPTTTTSVTRASDTTMFVVPMATTSLTYTFDDNSTQTLFALPGNYTIPATVITRPRIKSIYGNKGKEYTLDFLNNVLPNTLNFTRNSVGTYVNNNGFITIAQNNDARFAYNPVTYTPYGLLIEQQKTNRILNSNGSSWAKINTTIALAGAASPDGATNAFVVTDDGANTYHTVSSNEGSQYISGSIYTSSVYLKAGTQSIVQLTFSSGVINGNPYANYDLVNEVVSSFSGAIASITNAGNGWYRCSITGTAGSSTYSVSLILSGTNNNMSAPRAPTYQGTGLTYLAFGAQGEVGGSLTSLITTSGGVSVRVIDKLSISTPAWINPSEYSIIVEFYTPVAQGRYAYGVGLDDNTITNVVALGVTANNEPFVGSNIAGVTYLSGFGTVLASSVKIRVGLSCKSGQNLFSYNGTTLLSGTLGDKILPLSATTLTVGDRTAQDRTLNSSVTKIIYTRRALSQTELNTYTTP